MLSLLSKEMRTDIVMRMVNIDFIDPRLIKHIDNIFNSIITSSRGKKVVSKSGGIDTVAQILNQMDENTSKMTLAEIESSHQELAEQIREKMFVFEDLIAVDDRGIQELLKNVDQKELALALKKCSDELKEKIFRNMSERAAEMLKEEIEYMKGVRVKDVEKAQQNIAKIAKELEEQGKIVVRGRSGEEIID